MQSVPIQFPPLHQKDIVATYAQTRPYRKGGYRIQMQKIKDKMVYHNYGHGGSGVSLSYGSALQVLTLFKHSLTQLNQSNNCAVLGAGIIGLMTALVLSENGQKVKVYSEKIPNFGQKNNDSMITSEVAPGFWFPYDYADFQPQVTRRIATNSYDYLASCIKQNKFKAVKYVNVYQNVHSAQIYDKVLQKQMKNSFKKVQLNFTNGQKQQFNTYQTIKIDMQLWIHQLMTLLKNRGVQFVRLSFLNSKQVVNLKQKYIFNCFGNGARYVFNDQKMQGIGGHLIQFKNPDPKKYNYIFGTRVNQNIIRIYCHNQRIIIGLTTQKFQNTKVDKQIVSSLLKRAQKYFHQKSMPKPKL